jgi:O-antigen biosynthesis protein WbqV
MRRCRPDIVIHGAALKHVHFGERHPVECLLTNLVAVRNVAMAAEAVGASRFVLISTDKAAQPSCVMGATKRLAELFLLGCERDGVMRMGTRAVRFGNVLGSQGSVLPRFQAQIRAGGPLEVTHAEMERFFMSPEEAVGFILMTAAAPDVETTPAATCFMELGAPVSILQMGKRLIRKSGKSIEIKIVGLRAGEKLKEQLYDDCELVEATALENVFQVRPKSGDACLSLADIAHFEALARAAEDAVVRQRVFDFLDERLGRRRKAAG